MAEIARIGETKMLPFFSDGSPVLPPSLNYVLLALMREVGGGKSRTTEEDYVAFDAYRASAFKFLHEHFELETHEHALQIIKQAWDERAGFGLYLRNFSLGSSNSGIAPTQVGNEPYFNVITTTSLADLRLQFAIAKHVGGLLPFVGVENPAYDPRHKNSLPKLSLADDSWRQVVSKLIDAAEVIIIFYDQMSSGIHVELDMIRSLGRQSDTLVVRPSGELIASIDKTNYLRQEVSAALHHQTNLNQSNVSGGAEELADFPVTISWDESGHAVRRLKKAIAKLRQHQGRSRFSEECPAPLPPRPPEKVMQWAAASIGAHKLIARSETESGNLANAEDHLTTCLVVSFRSDNAYIRAGLFLWLTHIQWLQGKFGYALENLERSLDLFERLPPIDYSPLSEISSALQQYRKERRIRDILKRIRVLQNV